MLSRRTTTKVGAHNKNRSTIRIELIQNEGIVPNIAEKQLSVTAFLNPRKEPSRDNSIGIDLVLIENRDLAGVGGESRHELSLSHPW